MCMDSLHESEAGNQTPFNDKDITNEFPQQSFRQH